MLTVGCILCGISAGAFFLAKVAPRRCSDDQRIVADIPNFTSQATAAEALKTEAFEPVAATLEATAPDAVEPQEVTYEPVELDAVKLAAEQPDGAPFESVESDVVMLDPAHAQEAPFESVEPDVVKLDPVPPQEVTFVSPEPEVAEPEVAEPEVVEPEVVEPEVVEPDAAELDTTTPEAMAFGIAEFAAMPSDVAQVEPMQADSMDPAAVSSMGFSADEFTIPEPQRAFDVTPQLDREISGSPGSDPMEPKPAPAPPVPVQWLGVAELQAPSSQSEKRTTDPPFMNDRRRRVAVPPLEAANQPMGTVKLGAMQPATRTTTAPGKQATRSDSRECRVPEEAGKPGMRVPPGAPSPKVNRRIQ